MASERPHGDVLFIHVPLIVQIPGSGELKSKPTQHSVKELLSLGIQPDILVCRCDTPITEDIRRKIALFCNVEPDCVIQNATAETLYEVPLLMAKEGLDEVVCRKLGLITHQPDLREWSAMVKREKAAHKKVRIALGFPVVVDIDLGENQVPGALESVNAHNGEGLSTNVERPFFCF